jgi:hypothetical protein
MALESIGFCLEKTLAGAVALPGEELRLALAFIGLLVTSYYDIFNQRNVPDKLLYAFFLLAVLLHIPYFEPCLAVYSLAVGLPLAVFGYALYRYGQLGGADVLVLLSLVLLVPIHPSMTAVVPNYPFILSVLVFAFTLFTVYAIATFAVRLRTVKAVPDTKYLLLLVPYAIIIYMLAQLPMVSVVYLTVLSLAVLGSVFYLVYRMPVLQLLSQKLPLSSVQVEDAVAIERMDARIVQKYAIPRLITSAELQRLKKRKLPHIYIYTRLPPFLPFLLLGFILALFFSSALLGLP